MHFPIDKTKNFIVMDAIKFGSSKEFDVEITLYSSGF